MLKKTEKSTDSLTPKSLLNRSKKISLPPFKDEFFWILNLEDIGYKEIELAKTLLNEEDLRGVFRFHTKMEIHRRILVKAISKMILSEHSKIPPESMRLSQNEFGKPYIKGIALQFNLSHRRKRGFLAIHPHRAIGVDIEEDQKIETAHFPFKQDPLTFWCATEAILKAIGTGFAATSWPNFKVREKFDENIDCLRTEKEKVYVYHGAVQGHKLAIAIL